MRANVLLDLDGTLTDPGEGFIASIRHALATLGRPVPSDEVLRSCIGPPLEVGMAAILDTNDRALCAEVITLYRQRYGRIGLYENSIYPGIERVLSQLAMGGTALYLATSKPKVFADRIIDHFELRRYFRKNLRERTRWSSRRQGAIDHAFAAKRIAGPRNLLHSWGSIA